MHPTRYFRFSRLPLLSCAVLAGCGAPEPGAAPGEPTNPSTANVAGSAGGSPENLPDSSGEVAVNLEPSTTETALVGPRIRRLTNAEYRATVSHALGLDLDLDLNVPIEFEPESRQAGYTRNAESIVDPVLARQLEQAARTISEALPESSFYKSVNCTVASPNEACAREFLTRLLPKLYRRPVQAAEVDSLIETVYRLAEPAGEFQAGLALAVSAALQSAAFLYHTELGAEGSSATLASLTSFELASSLSYLLTGGPPDDELWSAAEADTLRDPAVRVEQARRLLGSGDAAQQLERLVKEWIAVDDVAHLAKDEQMYYGFLARRESMELETNRFIDEVMRTEGGSLSVLLDADFSILDQTMADFYGVELAGDGQRTSLADTPRRGLLSQASFLAKNATEVASSPVRRGVTIMRRVLCADPGDPSSLSITVPPAPAPDEHTTTRERFARHENDPACAGCHIRIDGLGDSFEEFDAVGAVRTEERPPGLPSEEPGLPVDTGGVIGAGLLTDVPETPVASSVELLALVSHHEDVYRCFASNLYRFAVATNGSELETQFLHLWDTLDATARASVTELLVAYVGSDLFAQRTTGGAN